MKINKIIFALFVFLLVNCVSKPFVWDDTIQENEMATIVLYVDVVINSYNGIKVDWKGVGKTYKFPAGETVIEISIRNGWIHCEELVFTYDFEKGKKYYIGMIAKHDEKWGVEIYKSTWPYNPIGFGVFEGEVIVK